jgi:hypothetical protein
MTYESLPGMTVSPQKPGPEASTHTKEITPIAWNYYASSFSTFRKFLAPVSGIESIN